MKVNIFQTEQRGIRISVEIQISTRLLFGVYERVTVNRDGVK